VEFAGRRIEVDEGVFGPRRRSELLVREAVTHLTRPTRPADRGPAVVADLCCGCGAVGVAIAAAVPGTAVLAGDLDATAVRCAARNLASVGGTVARGDLFAALPASRRGQVDLLVANAPYVPTAAIALMPPEARDHEPVVALDGGPDGTDVLHRVIAGASEWLTPDGMVLVELGRAQVPAVVRDFQRHGLNPRIVEDDELGGMVAAGRRSAPGTFRWQN
jgi:release factor glutamine methyltransferase